MDGDTASSWQEGEDGLGEGTGIRLDFDKTAKMRYMVLYLGNWRSENMWEANARPASLTISVGDLAKGLELAQKGFHANFDVIISRGGTARLLKQSVSLPVIEIGTTVYDVLCTLQRANIHEGRVAIVGYSNITQDMGILRTLLPYQLDVFTIQSSSQAVTTLQYLRREEYASVLCDMVTYTAAKEMDVNAFLITSSAESIRAASTRLFFSCSANRQLRSENQFLRQLLHKRTSQTVVFTRAGKLVFSHAGGRLRRAAGHAARKIRERGRRGTHQGHAAVPRAAVQH